VFFGLRERKNKQEHKKENSYGTKARKREKEEN
jgi:hypothetical protein